MTCSKTCTFSIFPQRLADWVAIQSVSAWPEKRGEIKRMMEVAAKDIERLGGTTQLMDIGKQKVGEHPHSSLAQSLFRRQGGFAPGGVLVSDDSSREGTQTL